MQPRLQGFELLVVCLFSGATFANLPKYPIPNDDILDIGIHVIHCMGLFPEEYKAWITRGNNPINTIGFAAFGTFWETAINIASFTATPALQHGYGMNAVEDDASADSLTNAVSNFGTAYAATQESLCNNNTSINAIQGQIQMLCNTIGNQPPAGMLQYPQQNNPDCQAPGSHCGKKQNLTQQGQPIGSGHGTTNGSGGNSLCRGNGGGGGYNQGSGMNFNGGGGNCPTPGTSHLPPPPLKQFENWNYCHIHGGNIHDTHTSATCAQPSENHHHTATRSNTMGDNNNRLHKTVLPSAVGQRPPAALPPLPSTNYTPIFLMLFGNNGPQFPTAPGSWGFGPHAAAYQRTNNTPPPQPGTSIMVNTM
jgi:hypothetical protein